MPDTVAPKRKRGRPPIEGLTERRQDEILSVATGVFVRQGYASTDLQVVADKLGVGKGTLYRYFPSKKAMFQAALARMLNGMRGCVDAAAAEHEDPLDQLSSVVRAYLSYFDEHPEYVELLIQERAEFRSDRRSAYFEHRAQRLGRWLDFYSRLITAGRMREVPVQRIADVLSKALYGAMFTNYFTGHQNSLAEQADEILDVMLNGLLTPAERERRAAKAGGA